MGMPTRITLKFKPPMFLFKVKPMGYLDSHPACHAMYYYWGLCQEHYTQQVKINIVQVGKPDPIFNYHQLMKSVGMAYGVEPQEMTNFWPNVKMQIRADGEPYLPELEQYLFHNPITIRTSN
jgi:hypothetical protein